MPVDAGETLRLDVAVHGTAPLWRADVLRWGSEGPEVVYRHPFAPEEDTPDRHRIRIGWTGSRIRARHRMTRWDGGLRVENGDARLVAATAWGIDQPEQGITHHDEREIRWASETAGDWDGVVVEVEGPETAALRFASGPVTFGFTPRELAGGPLVVEAGGVGQRVEVERDPGPEQPRTVDFSCEVPPLHSDSASTLDARPAYVVRITQQDGHVAWSSPIFLHARNQSL